jgi:hypothetical protein
LYELLKEFPAAGMYEDSQKGIRRIFVRRKVI